MRSDISQTTHNPAARNLKSETESANVSLSDPSVAAEDVKADIPEFLRKEIYDIKFPLSENLNFGTHNINTNILGYNMVANWDDLNTFLIKDEIECSICYSMIFYHSSLENRSSPLAHQCTLCQSYLYCRTCVESLKTCPICRNKDSKLEPASSILINEVKKMKFKCQYSISDHGCTVTEAMKPRELFQHYAFQCVVPQKLNRYTLKTRDKQICKYFCTLSYFETTPINCRRPYVKNNCENQDCHLKNRHLRQLCGKHLSKMTISEENYRSENGNLEGLKCYNCKALPKLSVMCSNCRQCILCLQCARTNIIRHHQCPECCYF